MKSFAVATLKNDPLPEFAGEERESGLKPAGSNVDHPELLGDKDEVDRLVGIETNIKLIVDLSGHPEAAGGLEGGHQLVLALLQQVRLPLHQRHRDIEGGQDWWRDQKPWQNIFYFWAFDWT